MKLTKTELGKLVRKARAHGYHLNVSTGRLWNKCPICGEEIECQDFKYKGAPDYGTRTVTQMLDAGMSDHLENYCSECPECHALRGNHEDECAKSSEKG